MPFDGLDLVVRSKYSIIEIQVYPAAYPREFEEVLWNLQDALKGSHCKVDSEIHFDGSRYQCKFSVSEKGLDFLNKKYPGDF